MIECCRQYESLYKDTPETRATLITLTLTDTRTNPIPPIRMDDPKFSEKIRNLPALVLEFCSFSW
jgi:hypothetical protein